MTDYTIWADRGTGDQKIYEVGKYLKKCAGGNVKVIGIGPNVGQSYGQHAGKGTVGVFMTNGVGIDTPEDFEIGCRPGGYYQYERCIFVWPQWIDNQYMSNKNIMEHIIPREHDFTSVQFGIGGKFTAANYFSSKKYVDLVAGTSPEDIAQRICSGTYVTQSGNPSSPNGGTGGTSSNSSSDSSSGASDSSVSPLLSGEMTFEELVGEICNGIDLMFLCKRSTVVVTDFETIFAEAKYLRDNHPKSVKSETVNLWQMEEDSYELNINQHGFYNTVYVKYKNGTVKESFEDLVRVYGEVAITYTDKGIDKSTAIMKAKAYLAAHMRDLELSVNTTMLTDADIDIGDIISIENPLTLTNSARTSQGRDAEFLFTKGVNTTWDGDEYIQSDIECQFSPTSPKRAEVPTAGSKGNSGDGSSSGGSSSSSSSSGMTFDQCGVSSDGKYVLSLAQPSAGRTGSLSYNTTYATIFKNKCPRCGQATLKWDSGLSGANCITCGGYHGSKSSWGDISESEVTCNSCCADFCGATGWEKDGAFSSRLSIYKAPVQASKEDKYKLMKGIYTL